MATSSSSSYWCYCCSRFVRVSRHSDVFSCPDCHTGFLEAVPSSLRRHHRFNPLILLRRGGATRPGGNLAPLSPTTATATTAAAFDLYYDDGSGSGLRPLPASMSEFLMGSGFDQLLHHLSHLDSAAGFGSETRKPPASKSSVESMPTIEITDLHVGSDSHCAVCTDPFVAGSEAREMPCRHIYHSECILPWLSVRNSCPVCRHEMPTDASPPDAGAEEEGAAVGLMVWRLLGGGYAVGRFSGSGSGREVPVVFTEMDGAAFSAGAGPGMVPLAVGTERSSRITRLFRSFVSLFGRRGRRAFRVPTRSGVVRTG
ncbi:putative E3 ubiquitin-protein ligase RING1 [Iris pallida]|uniref:RING-type E3 ubiquitin transferase n=1 Tax=Iris pallida TaxID=29817 RepID=A0AAX6FVN7_IRIPA|nr:putative E3 ubiquitin-protein ligase RING1 [Iris pallida]